MLQIRDLLHIVSLLIEVEKDGHCRDAEDLLLNSIERRSIIIRCEIVGTDFSDWKVPEMDGCRVKSFSILSLAVQ